MKEELVGKVLNSNKNILVEGDTKTGKTDLLFGIVDNCISNNESLFIFDSKEEYLGRYHDLLKEKGYKTIIINLKDMELSEGYNPLLYPYRLYKNGNRDRAQEYVQKICSSMFSERDNLDPFWTQSSSDFLTGVILGLFEDAKEEEVNFNSIVNMIAGIEDRFASEDYLTKYFKLKNTTDPAYVYACSTILAPKDTKASIVAIARQKLILYVSREKLSNLLYKSTFDMEDIINNKTAVFFIGREDNSSINTLGAVFIEQLYSMIVDHKGKSKFSFILDNFDSIEKCSDLNNILRSSNSYNTKVFISTGSINVFEKIYGNNTSILCDNVIIRKDEVELIINNNHEKFKNELGIVDIRESNIEYPTLRKNEIKLFDFKEVVLKYQNDVVNNMAFEGGIDDYIKKLDEKIAALEDEERLEKNISEDNTSSVFDKYKIGD